MGWLADTSWLIAVERSLVRDPSLAGRLPLDMNVSSVTIAELRMGVELADGAHRTNREAFVAAILRSATILPFGTDEAIAYGRAAAALRRAGLRIGERDLLIAATAIAGDHSLVTLNRAEFDRVPGLALAEPPVA